MGAYSLVTGVVFFAGFVGIAAGSGNPWTILAFCIRLMRHLSDTEEDT